MKGKGSITKLRNIYYTPDYVTEQIIPYLPVGATIWECACGNKNISNVLEKNGFKVISTDVDDGIDFLTDTIEEEYDFILTNPPFSLKSKFLSRCYELKKPFLLLCPITIMESNKRLILFKKYGITFFMPPKRVNFISSYDTDKKSKAPYFSIWVGLVDGYEKNTMIYL